MAGLDREQLKSTRAILVIREIPGRGGGGGEKNPLRAFRGEVGCLTQEVLQPQIAGCWRSILGRYQGMLGRLLHPSSDIHFWPLPERILAGWTFALELASTASLPEALVW